MRTLAIPSARTLFRFGFSVALTVGALASLAVGEEQTRIGRKIDGFRLPDFYGQQRTLDEFSDQKVVVVAFLGTDCPLVKLYAPRLAEMSEQFADRGVTFLGVNSNSQDSIAYIGAFARQHGVKFPILKDLGNTVADQFGAVRTPEVFVLDENRVVRYWGRIDDQYGLGASSGYAKNDVHRRDLAIAVEELLESKPVSEPITKAYGCLIGRVARVAPHGDVTYSNQIARIVQNRCLECHRAGEVGPMDLSTYSQVSGWAEMVREVVNEGRMPPWFANPEHGTFRNDKRLTDEEKSLIYQWVECGCPEGDPADLPPAQEYVEGWQIGQPDVVYNMADEPFEVAAEGTIDYEYFTVDPGFTEDKWIKKAEARPGNRAVVHHIIVFIEKPGGQRGERASGASIGFAPGMQPQEFSDGMAMKIPAGSKLRFQMHYTSNGSPQTDLSSVGFVFAKPSEVKQEVRGSATGNLSFRIPPHAEDYVIASRKRFRRDALLLGMLPHMHVRGTAFKYELELPDGQRQVLLDVPHYDFNWQYWYRPVEPVFIPKGSKIHCTAHFNNSASNPFNPDPTIEVTWGEQTWEEMMFGFMTMADPHEDLTEELAKKHADDDLTETIEGDDDVSNNVAF